uniref:Uncharacterized protein n=1 Tax=Arundo donax TaxID=35708 RepID=A0A0A8ZFR8_ARUDO
MAVASASKYADQTTNFSTPESVRRRKSAKMRSMTWSVKLSSTSAWRPHSFHAFVTTSTPAIDFSYRITSDGEPNN